MILRADNANIIKWYIDSDHAVQNDVRKHSREILQILKGSIISKSIQSSSDSVDIFVFNFCLIDLLMILPFKICNISLECFLRSCSPK